MKMKISSFLTLSWRKTDCQLRRLCGKPSPVKRLVTVIIVGGLLAAANIYFVVSSVYNIGKNDAQKEFMKLEHIERLNLQGNDSIRLITN